MSARLRIISGINQGIHAGVPAAMTTEGEMSINAYVFDHALLPSGWARDVRVDVADGTITHITPNAPREGAQHIAGLAIPGMPNLHCHAFQRGMAGLGETRGP